MAGRVTLGIDPGTAITGFGLIREGPTALEIVDFGVVTTPAGLPLADRLRTIYRGIDELIQRTHPTEMAVEELFFSKNVRTALAVGQARGVAILAAANRDLPVAEYSPLQIKQAIVGYGRARKEQVQEMVRILLNLPAIPEPDDAADALALAICHLHSSRMERIVSSQSHGSRG